MDKYINNPEMPHDGSTDIAQESDTEPRTRLGNVGAIITTPEGRRIAVTAYLNGEGNPTLVAWTADLQADTLNFGAYIEDLGVEIAMLNPATKMYEPYPNREEPPANV